MVVINKQQIRSLLNFDTAIPTTIELMATAMRQVSNGSARLPLRWGMPVPGDGLLGMMPGYIAEPECFGIKVVNMMPANASSERSSHLGCMMLFEAEHGLPLALIDAGEVTALRTAAASALATDLLSRKDSQKMAVIGSGEQALSHILAISNVRDFANISVYFRDLKKSEGFQKRLLDAGGPHITAVDRVADCLIDSDVVCTVSASAKPLIDSDLIKPGMHLNVVGSSTRDKQEVETQLLPRCKYFVDYRQSAEDQAGELINARASGLVNNRYIQGEIGDVLNNSVPGRESKTDITLYRSLGVAAQDLVLSHYLYQQACNQNLGSTVDFP